MRVGWQHVRPWSGVGLATLAALLGGVGYRLTSAAVNDALSIRLTLAHPLATLPRVFGEWTGQDVPISDSVQRIAMNDDYVNRLYRLRANGAGARLYVAYTAHPRTMLRHRPTVCYPSAGWSHVDTHAASIPLGGAYEGAPGQRVRRAARVYEPSGPRRNLGRIPVLVHTFLKPATDEARVVVLNYYVLNGAITVDEDSFWGLGWRNPNLSRNANRYVAQVQIMVPVRSDTDAAERTAMDFARDSAPAILALLPGSPCYGPSDDPRAQRDRQSN